MPNCRSLLSEINLCMALIAFIVVLIAGFSIVTAIFWYRKWLLVMVALSQQSTFIDWMQHYSVDYPTSSTTSLIYISCIWCQSINLTIHMLLSFVYGRPYFCFTELLTRDTITMVVFWSTQIIVFFLLPTKIWLYR